jgi:hypothetical protein
VPDLALKSSRLAGIAGKGGDGGANRLAKRNMTMKCTLLIAATAIALSAPAVPHAHAAPAYAKTTHLNANQRAGCMIIPGYGIRCNPGTGMAWKPGHDPELGQKGVLCDNDTSGVFVKPAGYPPPCPSRATPRPLPPSFDCVQAANNPEGPHCE